MCEVVTTTEPAREMRYVGSADIGAKLDRIIALLEKMSEGRRDEERDCGAKG